MQPAELLRYTFGKSPPYLYPAHASPEEIAHPPITHYLQPWIKEIITGRRSLEELVHAGLERKESLIQHLKEGFEFAQNMDYADRAVNAFREDLRQHNRNPLIPSPFGERLHRAYNNPLLADHNHEHSRRHERWIETLMLNIGDLRHNASIRDWVDSVFLFSYWHDIDQLLTLQRNIEENRDDELNAKAGHALAPTVMLLATKRRFQQARGLSEDRANEIIGGAIYMQMKHDEPEELIEAISGHENAIGLKGKALEIKFRANQLDLTTLSPQQLVELLTQIKKEHGFVSPHSKYGLLPEFEEEYQEELEALTKDQTPILPNLDEAKITSLRLAAETAVRSDVIEMVAPAQEAILRTLLTQYSQNRPFFFDQNLDELKGFLSSLNISYPIPSDASGLDILIHAILYGPGNMPKEYTHLDSDIRRLLWEFAHVEHISKDTAIARSRYMKQVNKDTTIMGLLALQEMGKRIIRGDYQDIDRIYRQRLVQATDKILERADVSLWERAFIHLLHRDFHYNYEAETIYSLLRDRGRRNLAERYIEKMNQLMTERDKIKVSLSQKQRQFHGGTKVYHQNHHGEEIERRIVNFEIITNRILGLLCDKSHYNVDEGELRKYATLVRKGKYSRTVPYKRYDSVSTVNFRRLKARR